MEKKTFPIDLESNQQLLAKCTWYLLSFVGFLHSLVSAGRQAGRWWRHQYAKGEQTVYLELCVMNYYFEGLFNVKKNETQKAVVGDKPLETVGLGWMWGSTITATEASVVRFPNCVVYWLYGALKLLIVMCYCGVWRDILSLVTVLFSVLLSNAYVRCRLTSLSRIVIKNMTSEEDLSCFI